MLSVCALDLDPPCLSGFPPCFQLYNIILTPNHPLQCDSYTKPTQFHGKYFASDIERMERNAVNPTRRGGGEAMGALWWIPFNGSCAAT